MTIVIIDDDTDDLEIIHEMATLIGFPYPVLTFDSPQPAIDHILSPGERVQLIIADVNMPKLSGFEVREKMIASGEPYKDIPFVFLSTSKTEDDLEKAKQLSVGAYYKKPTTFLAYKEIMLEIKKSHQL